MEKGTALKGREEERERPAVEMVSRTEQCSKNPTALEKKEETSRKTRRKMRKPNFRGSFTE